MPRKAIPSPYTLAENVDACKVLITFDTGRRSSNYPYDPLIERLEVSLTTAASSGRSSAIACSASPAITWQTGKAGSRSSVGWTTLRSSKPRPRYAACGPNTTEQSTAAGRLGNTSSSRPRLRRIGWPTLYAED